MATLEELLAAPVGTKAFSQDTSRVEEYVKYQHADERYDVCWVRLSTNDGGFDSDDLEGSTTTLEYEDQAKKLKDIIDGMERPEDGVVIPIQTPVVLVTGNGAYQYFPEGLMYPAQNDDDDSWVYYTFKSNNPLTHSRFVEVTYQGEKRPAVRGGDGLWTIAGAYGTVTDEELAQLDPEIKE